VASGRWKRDADSAPFAPDYDSGVAGSIVEAAMLRIDADLATAVLAYEEDGSLPHDLAPGHLRRMILHGLAEIFEHTLTPLGVMVREQLKRKEKRHERLRSNDDRLRNTSAERTTRGARIGGEDPGGGCGTDSPSTASGRAWVADRC